MIDQPAKYLVQLLSGDQVGTDSYDDQDANTHHVNRIEHISPIIRDAAMILVQTEAQNITAELVEELQKTGNAFGIIPKGRTQSKEQTGPIQVVSFDGGTKKSSALADTVRNQLESHGCAYHRLTNAKDATRILRIPQPIHLIGIVTDGRQTYCGLGESLCLHPEIEDLEKGIAGPASIGARHWFIQSCHSPFIWSDFGTYRTVPIAIMMDNPCAKTVICSKRVQIRVPGIVDLYIALCLEGHPIGEVVLRLNEHVDYRRFDTAPFFLLGDPSCRATPINFIQKVLPLGYPVDQFSHEKKLQLFLHRALSNLSNMTSTRNKLFGDGNRGGHKEQGRAWNASQRFPAQQAREEIRLQGAGSSSLEGLWNRYYEEQRPLRPLSVDVARLFLQTDGYYYRIGPAVSNHHYVTIGIEPTGDGQYRRKELNVSNGVHPLDEYRIRMHTDRDLATMDVSSRLEPGLRCQRTGSHIEFSYTNMDDDYKWIFGCVFFSDPNNVSKHKSANVFWKLMSNLKIEVVADVTTAGARACRDRSPHDKSAWIFDGKELSKDDTYTMAIQLQLGGGDAIFYALVEAFIFVDFCWNWLSFTYRSNGIEAWMNTNDYRRSIGLVPQ